MRGQAHDRSIRLDGKSKRSNGIYLAPGGATIGLESVGRETLVLLAEELLVLGSASALDLMRYA